MLFIKGDSMMKEGEYVLQTVIEPPFLLQWLLAVFSIPEELHVIGNDRNSFNLQLLVAV
jgi:hypothetical protein